jgi:RIO kinase 1
MADRQSPDPSAVGITFDTAGPRLPLSIAPSAVADEGFSAGLQCGSMPEYGLVDPEGAEEPGDEWPALDVSDTETDRVARGHDRDLAAFRERLLDADQFKLDDGVFDDATYAALYDLVQDGVLTAFGGPVSTGKEANVYTAMGGPAATETLRDAALDASEDPDPDPTVAVKLYRINASDFRDMRGYLAADPRFEGLGKKKDVVLAWTRKEYATLRRARRAGVRVPVPIAVERNALVMEFVGRDGERGRRLAEVDVENPETAYEVVREYMRRLHTAGIVHGDLSEYNLVVHDDRLYVIDLGQAVTTDHPNADDLLDRDCRTVASFFARQGIDTTADDLRAFVADDA